MSAVKRAIILAAGQGFQLDGINKVLIRHPYTRRSVLEHALQAFAGKDVTVVVGFRAVEIMQQFPELDYVINHQWAVSSNALSLGLALDDRPTYVVSGDIFFDPDLVTELDLAGPDVVLTDDRENRSLTAIHCVLGDDQTIVETYQGPVRSMAHPEAIGMFKISAPRVLNEWKRRCIRHGNLFVGQVLPCELDPIKCAPRGRHAFDEINTADDYLRLSKRGAEP
jgi:choline kinase